MIRMTRGGDTPIRFRVVTSMDISGYAATLEIGNFSAGATLDGGYGTVVVPQSVSMGLPHGKVTANAKVEDADGNVVQSLHVEAEAVERAVTDAETEIPVTLVPDCNNWSGGGGGGGEAALERIRQCVAPLDADKSPIHDIVTSLQSI